MPHFLQLISCLLPLGFFHIYAWCNKGQGWAQLMWSRRGSSFFGRLVWSYPHLLLICRQEANAGWGILAWDLSWTHFTFLPFHFSVSLSVSFSPYPPFFLLSSLVYPHTFDLLTLLSILIILNIFFPSRGHKPPDAMLPLNIPQLLSSVKASFLPRNQ